MRWQHIAGVCRLPLCRPLRDSFHAWLRLPSDESLGYCLSSSGLGLPPRRNVWMRFFFPACVGRPPDLGCRHNPLASGPSAPQGRSTRVHRFNVARLELSDVLHAPHGAIDNSPPFQRWVPIANAIRQPRRGDRKRATGEGVLPSGGVGIRHRMPAAPRPACATNFRGAQWLRRTSGDAHPTWRVVRALRRSRVLARSLCLGGNRLNRPGFPPGWQNLPHEIQSHTSAICGGICLTWGAASRIL